MFLSGAAAGRSVWGMKRLQLRRRTSAWEAETARGRQQDWRFWTSAATRRLHVSDSLQLTAEQTCSIRVNTSEERRPALRTLGANKKQMDFQLHGIHFFSYQNQCSVSVSVSAEKKGPEFMKSHTALCIGVLTPAGTCVCLIGMCCFYCTSYCDITNGLHLGSAHQCAAIGWIRM